MRTLSIALALLVAFGAAAAERFSYAVDVAGNTLTASYDLGGRRTDIRNPNTGHLYRYAYDRVGNVTSLSNDVMMAREDRFGGRVDHRYGYDALDRLVSAEGSWETRNGKREQYTLGFSYSDVHTPLRKTQEHTTRNRGTGRAIVQRRTSYDFAYEYGGSRPHAPSRIGDDDYRYDPNGNTTLVDDRRSGQRRTMVWDEEDRVASISDNGRTTAFVYDHSGIRTAKIGAGGETVYVNPLFTVRNGSVATKHVFIGTDRIASKLSPGRAHVSPRDDDLVSVMLGRWWLHRSASGWEHARNLEMNPHYRVPSALPDGGTPETNFLYFYHSDHLGSTSYVTDSEGELYEHVQYFPTGEVWVQEASNTERLPHLFTSRELDQETGLSYHTARYYNPRTSLWISADPIAPGYLDGAPNAGVYRPANLQTYCYGWNNPATVSDPDGACPVCVGLFLAGGTIVVASLVAWVGTEIAIQGASAAAASKGQKFDREPVDQARAEAMQITGNVADAYMLAGTLGEVAVRSPAPAPVRAPTASPTPRPVVQGGTEVVQRAMSRAEAASTEATGLVRGGRSGQHYVAGPGGVPASAGRAQADLALPQTPEVRVTMEVPRGRFSPSTPVAPRYGQPGGGTERMAEGAVPARILSVEPM